MHGRTTNRSQKAGDEVPAVPRAGTADPGGGAGGARERTGQVEGVAPRRGPGGVRMPRQWSERLPGLPLTAGVTRAADVCITISSWLLRQDEVQDRCHKLSALCHGAGRVPPACSDRDSHRRLALPPQPLQ